MGALALALVAPACTDLEEPPLSLAKTEHGLFEAVQGVLDAAQEVKAALAGATERAARADYGDTPLHRAAQSWNASEVKAALAAGADPNARGGV